MHAYQKANGFGELKIPGMWKDETEKDIPITISGKVKHSLFTPGPSL